MTNTTHEDKVKSTFNFSISTLEKVSKSCDVILKDSKMARDSGLYSLMSGILDTINSCPVFAFSESSIQRVEEIKAKPDARLVIPPIPSDGCIVVTDERMAFVQMWNTNGEWVDRIKQYESTAKDKGLFGTAEQSTSLVHISILRQLKEHNLSGVERIMIMISLFHISRDSEQLIGYNPLNLSIGLSERTDGNFFFCLEEEVRNPADSTMGSEMIRYIERDGKLIQTMPRQNKISNENMDKIDEVKRSNFQVVMDTLQYVAFTDLPVHYVVEERPAHIDAVRKKRAKAARFDDRERWIILDPEQVKKSMKNRTDLGGTHSSPSLHLRRAHDRILKHECFTTMKGTILRIRPTWIGDRSWGVKRTKYKVISRLGASKTQA
jgi:hypothetical protein